MRWITAAACIVLAGVGPALPGEEAVVDVPVRGSFEDVKQMLVLAIENQGLVVDHESNVGRMLSRTGKDLGASKNVYLHAEVLEFCSAALSRRVMEADPAMVAYCPYGVGMYVLPEDPETVHLVYRRHDARLTGAAAEAMKAVDQLLHDIVQEASQ